MSGIVIRNERSTMKAAMPMVMADGDKIVKFPYMQPVRATADLARRAMAQYSSLRIYTVEQWRKISGESMGKILVLRSEGIGDLIMLGVSLRRLGREGWNITLGCRNEFAYIAQRLEGVSSVIAFEAKDMQPSVPEKDFFSIHRLNLQVECDKLADRQPRIHIFARLLGLDVTPADDIEPRFSVDDETKAEGLAILGGVKGVVGLAPITSTDHRDYRRGPELALKLAEAGYTVALIYHSRDNEKEPSWRRGFPEHERIIDLRKKTTVKQLCGVIANLDAMISADSGPMHLALAMGIPTVCLEGPTPPDCYLAGYKTAKEVVLNPGMDCHGCMRRQRVSCMRPQNHECMHQDPALVIAALGRLPKPEERSSAPATVATLTHREQSSQAAVTPGRAPSIGHPARKLWMTMLFDDEPKPMMERFVERVVSHPAIERVIAINGAAERNGLCLTLAKTKKVEIIDHPYPRGAFYASNTMRNISFEAIPSGTPVVMMDPDEWFSPALYDWLPEWPSAGVRFAELARAAWKTEAEYDEAKHIPPGSHSPDRWPDWQPRLFMWDRHWKWERGAHMIVVNAPEPVKLPKDRFIVHVREETPHRPKHNAQWDKQFASWEERIEKKTYVMDYEKQLRDLEEAEKPKRRRAHATV